MSSPWQYTFSDAQQYLLDWLGTGTVDVPALRKLRQAIENSYRDVGTARLWSYFQTRGGPLTTSAYYSTGTVTYVDSTGVVTLSGGTFPTWAQYGMLRIGNVDCRVASRDSSTQVTLYSGTKFGQDFAAGTSYLIYRDTYPVPDNLMRIGTIKDANRMQTLQRVAPNEMIASRVTSQAPAVPFRYSIISDPHFSATMGLMFYPPPADIYSYVYMYHRWPRQFTCPQYNTGTVTSSTVTITGVGTAWTQAMVGCVIRFSPSTTLPPTGTAGSTPYSSQRFVTAVGSATSLTIDSALSAEVAAVRHEISDPIDLEGGSMYTAFLRRCELELGQIYQRQDVARLQQQYQMAMTQAGEADARSYDEKPGGVRAWSRVSDYQSLSDATS